jgi:hypothetical protein
VEFRIWPSRFMNFGKLRDEAEALTEESVPCDCEVWLD